MVTKISPEEWFRLTNFRPIGYPTNTYHVHVCPSELMILQLLLIGHIISATAHALILLSIHRTTSSSCFSSQSMLFLIMASVCFEARFPVPNSCVLKNSSTWKVNVVKYTYSRFRMMLLKEDIRHFYYKGRPMPL